MQTERQMATNPQTKPSDLGCESTARLLPSKFTIAIYWYYCPTGLNDLRAAVKVCSLYPRLYIAVAVVIKTTAHDEMWTWVPSHGSHTCYY